MANVYQPGHHFDGFIRAQLASGRYKDEDEVVRDALRLLEEREQRLAALDAALARGLDDIAAGRLHDADDVFDEAEARYRAKAEDA